MRSVCIATYNGEKFIARQLETILAQLSPADEVVIVDDCSKDGTLAVIEGMKDGRLKVHSNKRNRREVYSFSRAIELARGEIIFLADQDDIWLPGRVTLMEDELRHSGALLITTNFESVDEYERTMPLTFDGVRTSASQDYLRNIA